MYAFWSTRATPIQGPVQFHSEYCPRIHPRRYRVCYAQFRHALHLDGFDLRAEPMVMTVPAMEKERYFVFQLMDLYTFNFAYIGSRTTGNDGGDISDCRTGVARREARRHRQSARAETRPRHCGGSYAALQPGGPRQCEEDSGRLQGAAVVGFPWHCAAATASRGRMAQAHAASRRTHLPGVLQSTRVPAAVRLPAHPAKRSFASALRDRDRSGKPFDWPRSRPTRRCAHRRDGRGSARDRRPPRLARRQDRHLFGDRAFLKNDYVTRATGTQVGIGANSREEALSPILERDADGHPFDGRAHRFKLRFAKEGLPPVDAFWSITNYNLPQQLLVKNPINRYLINSPMLPDLKRDADGKLHRNRHPGGVPRQGARVELASGTLGPLVIWIYGPSTRSRRCWTTRYSAPRPTSSVRPRARHSTDPRWRQRESA